MSNEHATKRPFPEVTIRQGALVLAKELRLQDIAAANYDALLSGATTTPQSAASITPSTAGAAEQISRHMDAAAGVAGIETADRMQQLRSMTAIAAAQDPVMQALNSLLFGGVSVANARASHAGDPVRDAKDVTPAQQAATDAGYDQGNFPLADVYAPPTISSTGS